jgi:hypothetical protein
VVDVEVVGMVRVRYRESIAIFAAFFHFGAHEGRPTRLLFLLQWLHTDSLGWKVDIDVVNFLEEVFFEPIELSLSQVAHIDSFTGDLMTARMGSFGMTEMIDSGITMRIPRVGW